MAHRNSSGHVPSEAEIDEKFAAFQQWTADMGQALGERSEKPGWGMARFRQIAQSRGEFAKMWRAVCRSEEPGLRARWERDLVSGGVWREMERMVEKIEDIFAHIPTEGDDDPEPAGVGGVEG